MKPIFQTLAIACVLACLGRAHATSAVNDTTGGDSRIRVVPYKSNGVTTVRVQRGVVTRIVLEKDEKIEIPVVGLSSDCKSDADEWCISAVLGSNQIFVRPRDRATRNNMELHTSKRDYSIAFEVVNDKAARQDGPFYRVVFDYGGTKASDQGSSQVDRDTAAATLLQRTEASVARQLPKAIDFPYGVSPSQRLKAEGVQIRNTNYSKQVLDRGEDAEPTLVFDDGRFTYFEFLGAREIPAVFAHGSDGEPTRVNWHMSGNFVVVQRTARKFTLRLGDAVVGIFNEAYDPTGIDTPTSTVSPAVVREIKGEPR